MSQDTLEWTGERLTTMKDAEIMIEHLHRYALALELATGLEVLDIACGEGYGSNLLSSVASKVFGVDVSANTVEFAKNKYKAPNIRFIQGSATSIPLPDNTIDLVVSFETIEHLVEHEQMLAEIKRVLRPSGRLIMSSPDKMQYSDRTGYKNPFHLKELYREEFVGLIKSTFRFSQFYSQSMMYGSLITTDIDDCKGFREYRGDFTGITGNHRMKEPMYNLCIASDQANAESLIINQSFFNAPLLLTKMRSKEAEIYLSKTYRAGLLVTWPLRFIRNILR